MTALHINLFNIVASLFSVWVLCQVKLQQGPVQCPCDRERCGAQDEFFPSHTWSHAEAWSFFPHHTVPSTRLPLASCCLESQIPFSDLHLPPVTKMPRRNGNVVLCIASLPVLQQGLDEDSCALILLCKSAPSNIAWILLQITCPQLIHAYTIYLWSFPIASILCFKSNYCVRQQLWKHHFIKSIENGNSENVPV